jgi:hypothetical protein
VVAIDRVLHYAVEIRHLDRVVKCQIIKDGRSCVVRRERSC